MDSLPNDMLSEITNKMDNISLDNMSRTSREMRIMANNIAKTRLQQQYPRVYVEMEKLTSNVPYAEVLADLDLHKYRVVSYSRELWYLVPDVEVIMRTIANNLTYAIEYTENILTSDNTQAVENYYLYTRKNHNMPIVKYLNQKYPYRAKKNMLIIMGKIMVMFMPENYTLARYMTKDNIRLKNRDKDIKYLQDLYELTQEMPVSIRYSDVTILEVLAAIILSENMEYIKWFLKVYRDLFVEHKNEIIDLVLKSVNSDFIQNFREEYPEIILDRDQDFINALEHLDDLAYHTEQERLNREYLDALHRLGQRQNLDNSAYQLNSDPSNMLNFPGITPAPQNFDWRDVSFLRTNQQ